jgi:hypothetical protein
LQWGGKQGKITPILSEGTVANPNLSRMNVESLMNLRQRVDERLSLFFSKYQFLRRRRLTVSGTFFRYR